MDDLDGQEQADLALAIKLSLEASQPPDAKRKREDETSGEEPGPKKPALDRKQLEQERLARQRAREASSQPVASISRATPRPAAGPSRIATFASLTQPSASGSTSSNSSSSSRPSAPPLSFPEPTIRSTYNRNFPNDPKAVTFAQLRGPLDTLQSAIVCALCLKPEWLIPQCGSGTPWVIVANGDKDKVG
jgi:hypothetical protein